MLFVTCSAFLRAACWLLFVDRCVLFGDIFVGCVLIDGCCLVCVSCVVRFVLCGVRY